MVAQPEGGAVVTIGDCGLSVGPAQDYAAYYISRAALPR